MIRKTFFLILILGLVSACGATNAGQSDSQQDTSADYSLSEPVESTGEEIDLSIENVENETEESAKVVAEETVMVEEPADEVMAEEDSMMEEKMADDEAMAETEPNPTHKAMANEVMMEEDKTEEAAMTDEAMMEEDKAEETAMSDEAMMEENKAKESSMTDEAMMEEDKAEEAAMIDEAMAEEAMSGPAWFSADLVDVNSGETFTISDFKGKVVLVETMAVWCPLCTRQQSHIQALHQSIGERDDLVSLSLDIDPNENSNILKAHADKNGFNWHYAVAPPDVAREIGQLYGGQFLNPPATPMFIIDRQGEVHPLPFGDKAPDVLQEALQPFLSEG